MKTEKTGIFVIDYLVKEKVIKGKESKKLAEMINSNDTEMKNVAHIIILDRWKQIYPNSKITDKSILFKDEKNEQETNLTRGFGGSIKS